MSNWSGSVAVAGVYESPTRRDPNRHPFEIQAECVLGALANAGMSLPDVDGFATSAALEAEGAGPFSVIELAEWIGLRPTYFDSTDIGGASPISQIGHAAAAIHAGMAEVVVVSYAANSYSSSVRWGERTEDVEREGPGQFEVPYGRTIPSAFALAANRHMYEYGTTPEHLAQVAVTCRANAATNPDARYRSPITIDDVLTGPMIASPFHRLDCCVVTDSGGAVVVTTVERARDCPNQPARLLGFGESIHQQWLNQADSFVSSPGVTSGHRAFAQAGLSPTDIDVAQLYDANTFTPMIALEDLGFCQRGEAGEFVSSGAIARDGKIPINTDGGGLSSNHPGRRGIFTVVESVRQLRGRGPGAQVDNPEVALAHGFGGELSSCATVIMGV
jgi:acetyl-CoA C-acetyltransferase